MVKVDDKRSLRKRGGPRYDLCYGWRKDKRSKKYRDWIANIRKAMAKAHLRRRIKAQKEVEYNEEVYYTN